MLMMAAARGYDPARHPLHISQTYFRTRPLALYRPTIHHRIHHTWRFLPTISIPRHSQTIHRVQLCALRDAHHRFLSLVRRPTRIPTTKR